MEEEEAEEEIKGQLKELQERFKEVQGKYENKLKEYLISQNKNSGESSAVIPENRLLQVLQTLQRQTIQPTNGNDANNIQEESFLEMLSLLHKFRNIIVKVLELSKVMSPQQIISYIALVLQVFGVGPLTQILDKAAGLKGGATIMVLGFEIPWSFTALGNIINETLIITANPAYWVTSKFANFFANKLIGNFNVQGKERAASIRIACSLIFQAGLENGGEQKIDSSNSSTRPVDFTLVDFAYQLNGFIRKQLPNILNTLKMDQPTTSKSNAVDRKDSIECIGKQKEELQRKIDKLGLQHRSLDSKCIGNKCVVLDIIEETKDYAKGISFKEGRKEYRKVVTEKISQIFVSKFHISEQQRDNIQNKLSSKLVKKGITDIDSKAMRKLIDREKNILQNDSQMQTPCRICQLANKLIEKVLKVKETGSERKSYKHREKNKKFKEMWANRISEEFATELEISEQQKSSFRDYVELKLYNKRNRKAYIKCTKEAIPTYVIILQNILKMQHDDTQRILTIMQNERDGNTLLEKFNKGKIGVGNMQLTISHQDLEESLDKCLRERGYFCGSLNDEKHRVFLNGKIQVSPDQVGDLKLVVPLRIDVGQAHPVTPFLAEVHFNVQLSDSTPDKLMCVNLIYGTYKITEKPRIRIMGMRIKIGNFAVKIIERLEGTIIKSAVREAQAAVDTNLHKYTVLYEFHKFLPEGVILKRGVIDIRPRVGGSSNSVFDVDFNADFQYKVSIDIWKDEIFDGYSIGIFEFGKIRHIEMVNGRIKFDIPVSVIIIETILRGTIFGSFYLTYKTKEKRFAFNNLNVTSDNSILSLLILTSQVFFTSSRFLRGLENYVNNNLENIRLYAINFVQHKVQQGIPGTFAFDADSLTITNVDCRDNITVDFSLRSNNSSPNSSTMLYLDK